MSDLLGIAQAVANETGLFTSPSSVIGNTDTQVVQALALLNRLGSMLMRSYDWQRLQTEYHFNTVAVSVTGDTTSGSAVITNISDTSGISAGYLVSGNGIQSNTHVLTVDSSTQVTVDAACQSSWTATTLAFGQDKYSLPSDWDRQINRTQWDTSKRWELMGPKEPQEWEWLKSGIISTGPRLRYRIYGNYFQLWPVPDNGSRLGYEYISNKWALSSGGTAQSTFSADTDTCIFADDLMIIGLKMQLFKIKGFDASQFVEEFTDLLAMAQANDHGAPTLSMAPNVSSILLTPLNIPDSGYGSS